MGLTVSELEEWDERIRELVARFNLRCFPQEFEICDHNDMLGYMAYSGMPSRYSHWSYGKNFERQKMMYDYGVSGLPYEMVINSNPCVAYLMRDNSDLLQILTMAHVYGHNDFFANNFTFTSGTQAKHVLEKFKIHGSRIDSYMEDPSIGLELVEEAIDHAHAIGFQCQRNLAIKRLSQAELVSRRLEKAAGNQDEYREIHPKKTYVQPDLSKVPLEPEENLLLFIAENNPYLPEWKRDILRIVDYEMKYFIPQMETKIMNEGWASYWHHRILNQLDLPQGLNLEFIVRHNQVLRPSPGGLNPYHLGFIIWRDIERRWNLGDQIAKNSKEDCEIAERDVFAMTPGRQKMFEVRESDRDTSFLRRFLTEDIIRELSLFQHEKRGRERVITKVPDSENWQTIKETLIKTVGAASLPVIKIEDADFDGNRTLFLKHYHDGRDLQLDYAENTLKHVKSLWERRVVLDTIISGKPSLLKLVGETLKIERK
jgi:stage V sporulation protein R